MLIAPQKKQLLLAALGLYLLFCLFSPGRITTIDVGIRLAVTRSLWKSGTVFVPETYAFKSNLVYPKEKPGGTSFYGIGQSLVFIPFDLAGALLAKVVMAADPTIYQVIEWLPLLFLYAPLLGLAIAGSMTYILMRLGLSFSQSLGVSTLLSVSSIGFFYTTQVLQEEGLLGALFLGSTALLLKWEISHSRRTLFLAALLTTFCPLIRLNSIFGFIPLFFLYVSLRKARPKDFLKDLPIIFFAIAINLSLFMLFSEWRFGSPFSLGYDQPRPLGGSPGSLGGTFNILYPISVLFGQGKGIFFLSPILLLFFFFPWKKSTKLNPFFWGLAIAVVISVVFHSQLKAVTPDGAESWGTRFQVHLIYLMLIPCAWMLVHLWQDTRKRPALVALLLWSTSIQVVATMAPESLEYCSFPHGKTRPFSMVSSWQYGQLRSRLKHLRERFIFNTYHLPESSLCSPDQVEKLTTRYIPNYWGHAYAKQLRNATFAQAVRLLWYVLGVIAMFSLWKAFSQKARPASYDRICPMRSAF